MKRIALPILIIVFIVLATACGSPASTPTTQVPATQVASQPSVADTAPASGGTQVEVLLKDNTITASQTTFQAGVKYTFVITNSGRHAHDLNISTPVSEAGSLDAALQSALLAVPQEQLSVGASVTAEYTFPDSAIGQNLEFSCLIKRHYEDGMLLPITVTK